MLCQLCHKNEADQYYLGNWNDTIFVAGICSDCAENLENRASQYGHGDMVRRMIGLYPGKVTPRADGSVPFPEEADADLLRKTRLNELRAQLKEAAEREDYQEAARLRDEIERMEQEENCHES